MIATRIIFAGGGTGGHLFPAISIADEMKKLDPKTEIMFVGTKKKIEATVVPEKGYKFQTIWISGFHRSLKFGNLLFPLKVLVSFIQAYTLIRKYKPDVVVGTGSYISGPVLRAAAALNIPTLIHESNQYPGVTTRLLAPRVNEVHLTFESSKRFFPGLDNIFVSGNPTRANLDNANRVDALVFFGFDPLEQYHTLLLFGGSLGAQTINRACEGFIDRLLEKNIRVIWQTGNEDYPRIMNTVKKYRSTQVCAHPFINRMDYAYAASDLVVCRSGATTLAELTRLGKPAILIPYPHAAANHQMENAISIMQAGAAEIVSDRDAKEKLCDLILKTIEPQRRQQMGLRSKTLGNPNAAHEIALRIINLSRSHGRT